MIKVLSESPWLCKECLQRSGSSIPGVPGFGGARVWGASLAGPLDVITQPVKLLSRPKIPHSGKSQSGTFRFSFEFSTSIFCIFPPKKKKRHTEISCVFWQTSFHILVLVFFPLILCQDQIPLESLFVSLYPSTRGKTLYDYL